MSTCAHGGGAKGSGAGGSILDAQMDNSSGSVNPPGGGVAAIDAPTLAFSLTDTSDLIFTVSGFTIYVAVLCAVALDLIVSWTGGGGGSATVAIAHAEYGGLTVTAVPLVGQVIIPSVPAGDVTASLQVRDTSASADTQGVRRETDYPLVLKAEKIR